MLLSRQSATAKVGNVVEQCEVPRRKRTMENWTKENRKLWECYIRSKPKKRVIERECMRSGSRKHSVGEDSIEAAESDGTNEGEELQERI